MVAARPIRLFGLSEAQMEVLDGREAVVFGICRRSMINFPGMDEVIIIVDQETGTLPPRY